MLDDQTCGREEPADAGLGVAERVQIEPAGLGLVSFLNSMRFEP